MYGLLAHAGCGLDLSLREEWMAYMCGVCLSLKKQAGLLARFTSNGDVTLLSALVAAQSNQLPVRNDSVCLLRKPKHLKVISADDEGTKFGAGLALLMASSKIRDHLEDGELKLDLLRRPAALLGRHWSETARKILAPTGLDTHFIEKQIQNQSRLEKQGGLRVEDYAQPTELAVGATFSHTAILAAHPQNGEILFEIGRNFGRILYVVDSYKDYYDDTETGRFNAFGAQKTDTERRAEASLIFQNARIEVGSLLRQLTLSHSDLMHAVLIHRLGQIGSHALGLCHATTLGCNPAEHVAKSIQPGPGMLPPASGEEPGDGQHGVSSPCSNCCGRGNSSQCCYICPDCSRQQPACDCCLHCQNCECGHICDGCDCSELCNCLNCNSCDCGGTDCGGCDCSC